MNHHAVNVFIYIQSAAKPDIMSSMADKIGRLAGVEKVGISPKINRLLAIEYDPESIAATDLLNAVEQDGYHGALVGM